MTQKEKNFRKEINEIGLDYMLAYKAYLTQLPIMQEVIDRYEKLNIGRELHEIVEEEFKKIDPILVAEIQDLENKIN